MNNFSLPSFHLNFLQQLPILLVQTNEKLRIERVFGGLMDELDVSEEKILHKTLTELENDPNSTHKHAWLASSELYEKALLGIASDKIVAYREKFYHLHVEPLKEGSEIIGTMAMLSAFGLGNTQKGESEEIKDLLLYQGASILPIPTLILSLADNCIHLANEQFFKSFRYDERDILQQPITRLIDHIDVSLMRSRTRRRGMVRILELKLKRFGKNSNKTYITKAAVQAIQVADKRYLLIKLVDITKNVQNEDKWRTLVKSAPDYILHIDLEGHIQFINRTPSQVSISELMGRPVLNLIDRKDQEYFKHLLELAKQTRQAQRYEGLFYSYITQKRTTWLSVRIAPMITDDEVIGFALIATDITKIKESREQLSQSESKNKVLLDTMPDQMFLLSKDGIILDYKADQKDYYCLQNPIQKHISDVLLPTVAQKISQAIKETLRTKQPCTTQYSHLLDNGEFIYLEARTNLSSRGEILMIVRNITQQKMDEEAIRKSQREYKQLLNNIDEIVYAIAINPVEQTYEMTFVSEHLQSVLNYPINYFKKHSFRRWMRVIHPEDRRLVLENTIQFIQTQQRTSRLYRILHHTNKEYIWLEERINPQFNQLGTLTGYLGVARDVTSSKVAEEEKQRLISLIGSSHELIAMTNEKGVIEFINEAGANLLGVETVEKVIHTNILNYFVRSVRREIELEAFDLQDPWEAEVRIINRKKFMPLDVSASFFPIKLAKRQSNSVAVIMRDISERKRSERKIKQSEQKYRTLIDTMREGIMVLNNQDEIVYLNDRVCEMLGGYRQNEIIGKPIESLLFSQEHEQESHTTLANRNKLLPEQYELQLRKKNGDSLWTWVSSNPIQTNEKDSLGTILALADISSLKHTQHELVSVNEELENLIYRISHDLKSPISSVEGILNLFKIENDVNESTVRYYIKLIAESVSKLSKVVQELTKVSSIKEGKLSIELIDFDTMINDIVQTFSFYQNYHRIDFLIDIKTHKKFYTDTSLLRTIIQNLVENSIKYANLYLDKPIVHISVRDTQRGVELEFADNGIGIPKSHQAKIFNMFVRANEQEKGSGLGLYLVSNAVKKLEGTLHLESQEGEGSIFTIVLPNLEYRN